MFFLKFVSKLFNFFRYEWVFIHFCGLVTVRTEVKTKEPWWFFYSFFLSLSLLLWTWGLAWFYFFFSLFWRVHRYAHLTFDLHGVGCRPPLLLWNPSMPAGNPGAKAAKHSGLYTEQYSQWQRQLHSTITRRKKKTHTHTPAMSYNLHESTVTFFLFLRWWKKLVTIFWVRSHWSLLKGILQHVGHFQNNIHNLMKAITIIILIEEFMG